MTDRDHEQLADELEQESNQLERHARELDEKIEETRADWERRRADPGVPGAQPLDAGGDEPPSEQRGSSS